MTDAKSKWISIVNVLNFARICVGTTRKLVELKFLERGESSNFERSNVRFGNTKRQIKYFRYPFT